MIYPVGSIYLSLEEAFDPNNAFGGEWIKLTDRFLVGAGDTYNLGAEDGTADAIVVSHSHTATAQTSIYGSGYHEHTLAGAFKSDLNSGTTFDLGLVVENDINGQIVGVNSVSNDLRANLAGEHSHDAYTKVTVDTMGESGKKCKSSAISRCLYVEKKSIKINLHYTTKRLGISICSSLFIFFVNIIILYDNRL